MRLLNFIDGEFREPCKKQYLQSLNPSNEALLYECPDSCSADVDSAVQAAALAFPSWSRTTRIQRSAILFRIADALESQLAEFAAYESKDQGKPLSLALSVDIPRAIYNFRYFATLLPNQTDFASTLDGLAISRTEKTPLGVVALISPWNLPLYLLTWKLAPALAAGNCVVAKPSEITSLTAFKLCELIQGIVPRGVMNMVFHY